MIRRNLHIDKIHKNKIHTYNIPFSFTYSDNRDDWQAWSR